MKNLIKARIAPLFGFTARAAVIVCCIALLALAGCNELLGGPGSESDPYPLTIGTWKDGSISLVLNPVWYSFSVTKGNTYAVYQDDLYVGNPSTNKTADIMISAKYPKGNYIFGSLAEGIDTIPSNGTFEEPAQAQIFEASQSGTVLLCVQRVGLLISPYGSFAVKVSDISDPNATPVTFISVGHNGNATTTTTTLNLTFSAAINGLTADDIILTGMSGINKTLSGSGPTYTLQVNGFTSSGTVSVSVLKTGYRISGNPKTTPITYYGGGGSTKGLYAGIVGFNDDIYIKTPSLSLLDESSKGSFTTFINDLSLQPASALYYAVENAITMLDKATKPPELVNVSIVTFTDGADNASRALNKNYATVEAYRAAVKEMLATKKIGTLPISAYSIGLKGNDGRDNAVFQAELDDLKSNQGTATMVTNVSEVNATFEAIAKSLYSKSQFYSIKLRLTTGINSGQKIRFTFDSVADGSGVNASQTYIEGTFTEAANGNISLTDVVYVGMTPNNNEAVNGVKVAPVYVDFTFNVTSNLESMANNIKLWRAEGNTWAASSEFAGAGSVETKEEQKSAVIILVLDCSTSLGNDFDTMKSAANGFISTLVSGQQGN